MRQLSHGKCNAAVLRTLFIEQLPEAYKPIMTTIDEPDLQKLAETADKIADSFASGYPSSQSIASFNSASNSDSTTLLDRLNDITN